MSQRAQITFVDGSMMSDISLEALQEQLLHYKEQAGLTGQQLDWEYDNAVFPYTIGTKAEHEHLGFYLKGDGVLYRYILFGVGSTEQEDKVQHYVEVVLPDNATHGDKGKANELCKFLARKWKAQLTLFNGRHMYFNPRK